LDRAAIRLRASGTNRRMSSRQTLIWDNNYFFMLHDFQKV
jgi:hypothetical protein